VSDRCLGGVQAVAMDDAHVVAAAEEPSNVSKQLLALIIRQLDTTAAATIVRCYVLHGRLASLGARSCYDPRCRDF
jgi:hypothetical protein